VEAICTLLLFGFDEGISSKQQKTIRTQNDKIIVLEKKLAPRLLPPEEQQYLGNWLGSFKGKVVRVTSYTLDFEATWFGQLIIQGLHDGGIIPLSALGCEGAPGNLALGVHVFGSDQQLVDAILAVLSALEVTHSGDPLPLSASPACRGGIVYSPSLDRSDVDATIFVAIKPPGP
jgi:hypothetical protein